jgi:hypothetical protein
MPSSYNDCIRSVKALRGAGCGAVLQDVLQSRQEMYAENQRQDWVKEAIAKGLFPNYTGNYTSALDGELRAANLYKGSYKGNFGFFNKTDGQAIPETTLQAILPASCPATDMSSPLLHLTTTSILMLSAAVLTLACIVARPWLRSSGFLKKSNRNDSKKTDETLQILTMSHRG